MGLRSRVSPVTQSPRFAPAHNTYNWRTRARGRIIISLVLRMCASGKHKSISPRCWQIAFPFAPVGANTNGVSGQLANDRIALVISQRTHCVLCIFLFSPLLSISWPFYTEEERECDVCVRDLKKLSMTMSSFAGSWSSTIHKLFFICPKAIIRYWPFLGKKYYLEVCLSQNGLIFFTL